MANRIPVHLTPAIDAVIGKLFKNVLFGPDNQKSALVSRYLHTNDPLIKTEAIGYLKVLLADIGSNLTIEETEIIAHRWYKNNDIPFPAPTKPKFKFIDLFAGIGGFRLALQELGGECVFSSEWDKDAQKTYYTNFGEIPFGDITKQETKQWIPEQFDLLCGGFPCQPFSLAGVSKKNSLGRKHGFEDEKQGNLFFEIADILKKHRPKVFFLENVKNLASHDKGNTFKTIQRILFDLKYSIHTQIIDAKYFVPQHRERIFIVGFDSQVFNYNEPFKFPVYPKDRVKVADILETEPEAKYTLSDNLWNYLQEYALKHKLKGNGFGYGMVNLGDPNAHTRTMSARYYKDGAEILIPQGNKNPRRLIPRESARLQGYPENFRIDTVSDQQIYRQFGNSVAVPVIRAIGERIVPILNKVKKNPDFYLK